MTVDNRICDFWTEWILEKGWELSCKFMREIENELNLQGQLPVSILLASTNLIQKWLDFARKN